VVELLKLSLFYIYVQWLALWFSNTISTWKLTFSEGLGSLWSM